MEKITQTIFICNEHDNSIQLDEQKSIDNHQLRHTLYKYTHHYTQSTCVHKDTDTKNTNTQKLRLNRQKYSVTQKNTQTYG